MYHIREIVTGPSSGHHRCKKKHGGTERLPPALPIDFLEDKPLFPKAGKQLLRGNDLDRRFAEILHVTGDNIVGIDLFRATRDKAVLIIAPSCR